MLVLEIAILVPLFSGLILGIHAILRPASPPHFEGIFKRKYRRTEWNERNPEAFTQKIGWIILISSIIYGLLIVLPWLFR